VFGISASDPIIGPLANCKQVTQYKQQALPSVLITTILHIHLYATYESRRHSKPFKKYW